MRVERRPASVDTGAHNRSKWPRNTELVTVDQCGAVRIALRIGCRKADCEWQPAASEKQIDQSMRNPAVAVGERMEGNELHSGPASLGHGAQIGSCCENGQRIRQLFELGRHVSMMRSEMGAPNSHTRRTRLPAAHNKSRVCGLEIGGCLSRSLILPGQHHSLHRIYPGRTGVVRIGGHHAWGMLRRKVVRPDHSWASCDAANAATVEA